MSLVAEFWAADASPLILLAKIDILRLVPCLTLRLIIPEAVVTEIDAGPAGDAGRLLVGEMIRDGGALVYAPPIPPEVAALRLGKGETAVIAAALERQKGGLGVEAVLDDGPARAAAKTLGVPTIGTLGILIRAKDNGDINAVAPYLRRLRIAKQWLTDDLCRRVAASVGETWP